MFPKIDERDDCDPLLPLSHWTHVSKFCSTREIKRETRYSFNPLALQLQRHIFSGFVFFLLLKLLIPLPSVPCSGERLVFHRDPRRPTWASVPDQLGVSGAGRGFFYWPVQTGERGVQGPRYGQFS